MPFSLDQYANCLLCPRRCGVNRLAGERGFCDMPPQPMIARVSLHMWEEPCISGVRGSGTVFFAGCSLGCAYCQNKSILSSHTVKGGGADLSHCRPVSENELSRYFLRLQEAGAHNINLVTAAHVLPSVAEALREAKASGLRIPVLYNTSGYENVSSLAAMEGLIDGYLTDYRYLFPGTAALYSRAPDYPTAAREALEEMVRQRPLSFDENGLLLSGVLVRILLLPGHVKEAQQILSFLHDRFGDRIYISLLSQYTPQEQVASDPLLSRSVTKREYGRFLKHALSLGITQAYIQEGSSASASFIPSFDGSVLL